METQGTTQSTVPPTVETSDFAYQPPEQESEENLNDLARDAIADIAGEFQEDEAKRWLEENPEEPEEGTEDPEAEVDPDADPDAEPEEEGDEEEVFEPKMAKGIERVIARELAAKEREAKAEAAVKAAEAKIAELKGLEGLRSTKEIQEMAEADPLGAIEALGQDPVTFVRLAMAQSLGDKAPDELKEFARDAARNAKIARLEAKLKDSERKAAEVAFFNSVSTAAQQYVNDPGTRKKYPTLAKIAEADPARAHREIMEEIARDARERAATDPNGQHLSYEEAAKLVEKRAIEWAKLLGTGLSTTPQGPEGSRGKAATQGKKPTVTPPATKAPTRPLTTQKPWEVKNDLEEQGLIEAMREFHRHEAAARQRRR